MRKRQFIMPKQLTLQSGDLSLDWSAGQRVLQGINMDFIGSCNLMEKKMVVTMKIALRLSMHTMQTSTWVCITAHAECKIN